MGWRGGGGRSLDRLHGLPGEVQEQGHVQARPVEVGLGRLRRGAVHEVVSAVPHALEARELRVMAWPVSTSAASIVAACAPFPASMRYPAACTTTRAARRPASYNMASDHGA